MNEEWLITVLWIHSLLKGWTTFYSLLELGYSFGGVVQVFCLFLFWWSFIFCMMVKFLIHSGYEFFVDYIWCKIPYPLIGFLFHSLKGCLRFTEVCLFVYLRKRMKNAFHGCMILDITVERISELEYWPIKNSQTKMQKGKKIKTDSGAMGQFQKKWHIHNWNIRRRKKRGWNIRNIWCNSSQKWSKINERCRITDPGNLEKSKQNKVLKEKLSKVWKEKISNFLEIYSQENYISKMREI